MGFLRYTAGNPFFDKAVMKRMPAVDNFQTEDFPLTFSLSPFVPDHTHFYKYTLSLHTNLEILLNYLLLRKYGTFSACLQAASPTPSLCLVFIKQGLR